eukprot:UN21134
MGIRISSSQKCVEFIMD